MWGGRSGGASEGRGESGSQPTRQLAHKWGSDRDKAAALALLDEGSMFLFVSPSHTAIDELSECASPLIALAHTSSRTIASMWGAPDKASATLNQKRRVRCTCATLGSIVDSQNTVHGAGTWTVSRQPVAAAAIAASVGKQSPFARLTFQVGVSRRTRPENVTGEPVFLVNSPPGGR